MDDEDHNGKTKTYAGKRKGAKKAGGKKAGKKR
jgi:hypothetical protein